MKKQFLFSLGSTIVIVGFLQAQPLHNEETPYKQALTQLHKYLEKSNLSKDEVTILLEKLENYFSAQMQPTPALESAQAQAIYGNITQSYTKILVREKENAKKKANKFIRKALQALRDYQEITV